MNRGELRTIVLDRVSWHADVDETFEAEVNRACIDPAISRLASEIPEAVIPDEETIRLITDRTSTSLGRTLTPTTDVRVMSFGLDTLPGGSEILTDGTWDGLWLEITRANGDVLRYQARTFWKPASGAYKDYYLVSLDRPWVYPSDSALTFRLYQKYIYTRDDVTSVVDGRVWDTRRTVFRVLPAGFARYAQVEDFRGQTRAPSAFLSRWGVFQMPAPARTPSVALDSKGGVWSTSQEAPGQFKYRYTYVWGKKTHIQAPGGSDDPMWESSPSAESATISVAGIPSAAVSLYNLTNIDWMQDFDPSPATLRNGHSGWRKRIYRARITTVAGGTTEDVVEAAEVYYYLAEVDGNTTEFIDDGTYIPDYSRRLTESHGYYSWRVSPQTDADCDLDLRVTRRPGKLMTDTDVPPIHPDFNDMLMLLVLKYICEMDSQPAKAADYEAQYVDRRDNFRAKEANPADYIPPNPWVPDIGLYFNDYPFYGRFTSTTP